MAPLSTVLGSDRAIEVNIAIMRAFVRLREIISSHKDLARNLDDLERKLGEHDQNFQAVFEAPGRSEQHQRARFVARPPTGLAAVRR